MTFFFLPFYYFFKTRVSSVTKGISWAIIYLLPIMVLSFINLGTDSFVFCLIYITGIYVVYEIGYIWNDTETIKNEENPTLRLDSNQLAFYQEHKKKIYTFRLLLAAVIAYLFSMYHQGYSIFLLVNMVLIILTYIYYNSIRSNINLLLHAVLVSLRCSFIFIPFGLKYFIISFLLFPLLNLLERASQKRFNLVFFQRFILSNKSSGRFLYYLSIIPIIYIISDDYLVLSLPIFLFLFRFLSEVYYKGDVS